MTLRQPLELPVLPPSKTTSPNTLSVTAVETPSAYTQTAQNPTRALGCNQFVVRLGGFEPSTPALGERY